ncbi:retrovirus-related pol polyprotein from transposon TNT 1-94 [Tanacetum coccineum]|uniref:Retrovirus-related pol polyprotein from transposon TNT 1-94 n=1 Tax=Tanacetum coccineum TaxID=301880 RepID=A0ABQ4XB92_9ASTR
MSTSKTYQQSLADAGSETRPPMLERGSYIPWASRFRRYINRKRENRKWLNKALDEGPYQFEMFIPNNSTVLKLQTAEDLQGDALLHYDAKMELMNLILISIPNDIYNSIDACTSAKDIWKRVERLMRGTIQNKVDRETRFTNEFDQFVAEPGETLVLVYNRFAQLMNDLERNDMHFPIKFEKLVNVSRAKKLEKSHDPLALIAHTGSSPRNTSSYYVTHPTSVVDYEDEYQQDDVHTNSKDPLAPAMLLLAQAITQNFSTSINNRLRTSSNTRNQAIIQGDRVNIQSRNSGNTSIVQCYNCSRKGHYARNYPKPRVRDSKYFMEQMLLAKQDEAGVILTDEQNDFLFADASRMEEIEELSANICLMARIQPADNTSNAGPSYDSAFISEVQSSSNNENEEQMNVNSGSIEKDTHVPDLCALEQLVRNAYQEAEKQQIFAQKVQTQNTHLTSQIEMYKERVYLECFRNLFQRDIKEMKYVFESTESELDELEKQNELLKDQLLEASLKHDVELCVLINHECVDKILNAELEKVKKKSFENQEDLQARIKILKKDVQRCEKAKLLIFN